jgi:hypothetical protein
MSSSESDERLGRKMRVLIDILESNIDPEQPFSTIIEKFIAAGDPIPEDATCLLFAAQEFEKITGQSKSEKENAIKALREQLDEQAEELRDALEKHNVLQLQICHLQYIIEELKGVTGEFDQAMS